MITQEIKATIDCIRNEWNWSCQYIRWCKPIAHNRKAYVTETWSIREVNCKIVIREFIASDLFYLQAIGVRYWDYLQKRKDNIVRAMGLDPRNFEVY